MSTGLEWLKILGPTFFTVVGGLMVLVIQQRLQALRAPSDNLRQQRMQHYIEVLQPIVDSFAQASSPNSNKAKQKPDIAELRRKSFHLVLFGEDIVIPNNKNTCILGR